MEYLILLPALIAIYLIMQGKAEKAFYYIAIPVYMLTPNYLYAKIPLIANVNFIGGVILVIFVWAISDREITQRTKILDFFILLYVLTIVFSYSIKYDTSAGMYLIRSELIKCYLTFFVFRHFSRNKKSVNKILNIMFSCMLILSVFGIPEFLRKIAYKDFFKALSKGYMGARQFRYGLQRVMFAFDHAIIAGILISIAGLIGIYFLQYTNFKRKLTFKIIIISITLIETISRGPILIYFLVVMTVILIYSQKSIGQKIFFAIVVMLGVVIMGSAFKENLNDRETANSADYRINMMQKYPSIIMNSPLVGYGGKIPLPDMGASYKLEGGGISIDNGYLFLLLGYGVPTMTIYGIIMLIGLVQSIAIVRLTSMNKKIKFNIGQLFVTIIILLLTNYLFVWMSDGILIFNFALLGMINGLYNYYKNLEEEKDNNDWYSLNTF